MGDSRGFLAANAGCAAADAEDLPEAQAGQGRRPTGTEPRTEATPEDWFAQRTYRWQAWTLEELVAEKESTGLSVSLVVPARNEAATVGAVVSRVREALVDTVALLDEIVVIDSDSEDDTCSVAADAGAVVHRSQDIRPDLGSLPGKGEAMWKSTFVTTGGLLVFMDADLLDWDTHFVPGLLGPLLTEPAVSLVKGFYERPYRSGDVLTPYQGGRVTELVARPLIALLFPELAGLVQPLAGEWAIRRSLFESLSVPTGYAVELAALVDTARTLGTDAIAQVDLGRRTHRHQNLQDLGAMATQVMAAAWSRSSGKPSAEAVTLRQYSPVDGVIGPLDRQTPLSERPAARSVAPASSSRTAGERPHQHNGTGTATEHRNDGPTNDESGSRRAKVRSGAPGRDSSGR